MDKRRITQNVPQNTTRFRNRMSLEIFKFKVTTKKTTKYHNLKYFYVPKTRHNTPFSLIHGDQKTDHQDTQRIHITLCQGGGEVPGGVGRDRITVSVSLEGAGNILGIKPL